MTFPEIETMNPLEYAYEDIMAAIMLDPLITKTLFDNMKIWDITSNMKEHMLKIIKSSEVYVELERKVKIAEMLTASKIEAFQLPFIDKEGLAEIANNAIYQNAILAIKCHIDQVQKHIHMTQNLDVTWMLVVHEYYTGTLFDLKSGKGIVINMLDNGHLTEASGCIVCFDESIPEFQHIIVYGTMPIPEYHL